MEENIIGKKFGRITILYYEFKDNRYVKHYRCKCDCGKEKTISLKALIDGATLSCGCLGKERRLKGLIKHGNSKHKLYKIFSDMKQRCINPNNKSYPYYGARGIRVCNEWINKNNGFSNFYNWAIKNGYEYGLTIDRIDVDGDYSPSNCRWANRKQQSNNKRNNIHVEYNGKLQSCTELAEQFGIKPSTLAYRLKTLDVETALNKPLSNSNKIEYNGQMLNFETIAKMNNIIPNSLKYQYKKHNNIYDAISYFKEKKCKKSMM